MAERIAPQEADYAPLIRPTELASRVAAVLPFEAPADVAYGALRAELEAKGRLIGPNDMLIAAQVRTLGYVLVTNNEGEFRRVPNLRVENWLR